MLAVFFVSCSNGQTESGEAKTLLSGTEFSAKIKEIPAAPVIDVRTPDEYFGGHISEALNYDWNGTNFDKQVATLKKNEPVFVYCRSGGRSASAVRRMKSLGFTQVFELDGGIMAWEGAKMPVE